MDKKNKYEIKLHPKYYEFILNGTKRIVIRLNDDKKKDISVGDVIKFVRKPDFDESFYAEVVELVRYRSFIDMFNDYNMDILADKSITKDELIDVVEKFYTKEKQDKYGVLGIKIDNIVKN